MLTEIIFIPGLFLIFLFGYKLSKILLPDVEKSEQISLGYILGIGIFTFIWFLLNWAGIPYNLESGFALLLLFNFILLVVDRLLHKITKGKSIIDLFYLKKLNTIEKFMIGVIVFLSVSALAQNIYWPIRYWDSLVLYDFRAKVFTQTGFMQEAITRGYFFGYPLLTSLAHTWVYLLGGTNPSFLYALLYIFLLVNIFSNLKKLNIGRMMTIFLTVLVAVSPRLFDHTQWAYTNLPYSIYIVLGSIYLYFGIKKKNLRSFIVSALLIGLSTWTRTTEPFWLSCVAMGIIFSIFIKKWLWPFFYVAIVGSIMLPWRIFESIYENTNANVLNQVVSTSQGVIQNLQVSILKPTFNFFIINVVQMYLVYFILLGATLLIKLFIKSKEWFFAILIIFDLALTFAGILMFVKYTPYWQEIPDSLSRMVMFIPVLITFLLAELLSEIKKR